MPTTSNPSAGSDSAAVRQRPKRVVILERDAATLARLAVPVDADPSLELVTAISETSSMFELVASVQPDVALVNSRIRPTGSADVVQKLREACPKIRCIALSNGDDQAEVAAMVAVGAVACIDREASGPSIAEAIHEPGRLTVALSGERSETMRAEPSLNALGSDAGAARSAAGPLF